MRERRGRSYFRFQIVGVALALLLGAGCVSAPKQTQLMKQSQATDLTSAKLRVLVHSFVDRFSGVVENASDRIAMETDDLDVRRNATLWKMNAIPASHRAAFQYDPLSGLLDTWVLCEQQRRFFDERGAGADLFGAAQPIAIEASSQLANDIAALARKVSAVPDARRGVQIVDDWVEEHPLEGLSFARVSPREALVPLIKDTRTGVGATMGVLSENLGDLSDRMAIYAAHMPNQARWQGEILIDDLMDEPYMVETLEDVDVIARSLDVVASVVQTLPEELQTQIEPLLQPMLEVISAERAVLTEFAHAERVETLAFVKAEREAMLEALAQERVALTVDLSRQRVDTLEWLEEAIERKIDHSAHGFEVAASRLIRQTVLMVGVLLVVLGLLAIIALKVLGFGR